MTWTLPDPMLAASVTDPTLPLGWAAEPKWDGWRAMVSADTGRIALRSRRGADLKPLLSRLCSVALRQSGAKNTLLIRHMDLTRPATERRSPSSRVS